MKNVMFVLPAVCLVICGCDGSKTAGVPNVNPEAIVVEGMPMTSSAFLEKYCLGKLDLPGDIDLCNRIRYQVPKDRAIAELKSLREKALIDNEKAKIDMEKQKAEDAIHKKDAELRLAAAKKRNEEIKNAAKQRIAARDAASKQTK